MSKKTKPRSIGFWQLSLFLKQNEQLNVKTANFSDSKTFESYNWKGIDKQKKQVLEQLRGYQRLAKIVPTGNHQAIIALLKADIHAATQIAALPKMHFIANYKACFENDLQLATKTHANAVSRRSKLLLRYIRGKSQYHSSKLIRN